MSSVHSQIQSRWESSSLITSLILCLTASLNGKLCFQGWEIKESAEWDYPECRWKDYCSSLNLSLGPSQFFYKAQVHKSRSTMCKTRAVLRKNWEMLFWVSIYFIVVFDVCNFANCKQLSWNEGRTILQGMKPRGTSLLSNVTLWIQTAVKNIIIPIVFLLSSFTA